MRNCVVHQRGIESMVPMVEIWSFNHWTTREAPHLIFYDGVHYTGGVITNVCVCVCILVSFELKHNKPRPSWSLSHYIDYSKWLTLKFRWQLLIQYLIFWAKACTRNVSADIWWIRKMGGKNPRPKNTQRTKILKDEARIQVSTKIINLYNHN